MPHRVVIVGAGFSGLCIAIALRRAGYEDFVILEKADELGGTWRENIYPGCKCDVPSHKYSYSFELKLNWEHRYARQPEIWADLREIASRYQLSRHIRFGVEVVAAEFDNRNSRWLIATNEATYVADALVLAIGPLHVSIHGVSAYCLMETGAYGVGAELRPGAGAFRSRAVRSWRSRSLVRRR